LCTEKLGGFYLTNQNEELQFAQVQCNSLQCNQDSSPQSKKYFIKSSMILKFRLILEDKNKNITNVKGSGLSVWVFPQLQAFKNSTPEKCGIVGRILHSIKYFFETKY